MSGTTLNLGLLEGVGDLDLKVAHTPAQNGPQQAYELPIDRIDPDPDQPRKDLTTGIDELAADIERRGLLQPVIVRVHPTKASRFMLAYGGRRLEACRRLGRETIAAVLTATMDDYAQVAENEQRRNLTPMELAWFVGRRKAAGDKVGEIGKQLGRDRNFASYLLRLLTADECIQEACTDGRIAAAETGADLSRLFERDPEAVRTLLDEAGREGSKVTRADVRRLERAQKAEQTPEVAETPSKAEKPAIESPSPASSTRAEVKPIPKPRRDDAEAWIPYPTVAVSMTETKHHAAIVLDGEATPAGYVRVIDSEGVEHVVESERCRLLGVVDRWPRQA